MRKVELTKKKILLEDDIEEIFEEVVKPIGNGALIMAMKKYIGKKVYILVRKN